MSVCGSWLAQGTSRNGRWSCAMYFALLAGFLSFAEPVMLRAQMTFASAPPQTLQVSGSDVMIGGMRVSPKPGDPFTGKMLEAETNVGGAHTQIQFTRVRMVARDYSGRVYYESGRTISRGGKFAPRGQFFIVDRTAGTLTTCYPQTKSCRIDELRVVSYEDSSTAKTHPPSSTTQTTLLGTDTKNGFKVTITRETTTIAAGFSDLDRPVVTGKEVFYCPGLGRDIALKSADPRRGMWAREIQDIVRAEPDAKEFAPVYEIFDNRPREKR